MINQCDLAVALGISDTAIRRQVERYRKDLLTPEQIDERLSVKLHNVRPRGSP
jgi:hypothetical protein